jgi:hypothetical protein
MPGWRVIAEPTPGPSPCTTLNRPAGSPASTASWATWTIEKGVSSEGLRTTPLPAARAGATFQIASTSGKFHGAIAPITP